jgi:hypothetical protein
MGAVRHCTLGGWFTYWGVYGKLAKWNGTSWSGLSYGLNSTVEGLTISDDQTRLYDGGFFTYACCSQPFLYIASWGDWGTLGSGMNNGVLALTNFNDGGGPALYADGTSPPSAGSAPIASPNETGELVGPRAWTNAGVFALAVFDDDSGPALYAPFYWLILLEKLLLASMGKSWHRQIYLYYCGVIYFTGSQPCPHRSFSTNSTNLSKSS